MTNGGQSPERRFKFARTGVIGALMYRSLMPFGYSKEREGMSLFGKLFGRAGAPEAQAETYEGFRITVTPIKEGDTFRVCALIEKDVAGETLSHKLVRADTVQGFEAAQAASLRKAKQVIDEQGERIFGPR